MNIPADLPTPDQENVYYSVKSLMIEFSKYFTTEKVKALRKIVSEYYFPTFVFDDNDAPNSYLLRVYPRHGTSFSVLMDSEGAITGETKVPEVSINEPEPDRVIDNGSRVLLDPTFYSQARLKSNDFFIQMPVDRETKIEIDLLIGTKFWYDEAYAKERYQFLQITRNIVQSTFKSLPEAELKALKEQFNTISNEIIATIDVLEKIKEGQSTSLDSLLFSEQLTKTYLQDKTKLALVDPSLVGIEGTKRNVAQSIHDLVLIKDAGAPGKFRKGSLVVKEGQPAVNKIMPEESVDSNAVSLQKIYDEAVNSIKSRYDEAEDPIESIKSAFTSGLEGFIPFNKIDSQVQDLLIDSGKEYFSPDGWLQDWYYDNFGKKIKNEEVDFSGLEKFAEKFQDITSRTSKVANRDLLSGERLLVLQAILKSILNLCQSNIDISKYAPTFDSGLPQSTPVPMYDRMQRSPILGPTQTHQYPSRSSQPNPTDDDFTGNEYKIESFSKPGFLCYGALLTMLEKIIGNSTAKDFVRNNVLAFDSDHDSTIELWKAMFPGAIDWKQSYSVANTTLRTYKDLMSLYAKNEQWEQQSPLLIPRGDSKVSADQRSFFSFYVPPVLHEEEEFIVLYYGGEPTESLEGMRMVSDRYPSMMQAGSYAMDPGTFQLHWERMGHGQVSDQAAAVKRTVDVDYGVSPNRGLGGTNMNVAAVNAAMVNVNSIESSGTVVTEVSEGSTFNYWQHKSYNMPYFWASIMSINRALVYDAYDNLLESIGDILGLEIEIEHSEYKGLFDLQMMWDSIMEVCSLLKDEYGSSLSMFPSPDGTISFRGNTGDSSADHADLFDPYYWNTTGSMTVSMVNKYINFVSLCSSKLKLEIANDFEPIEFDSETYLPPEVFAVDTNQNYKNGHGSFGAYISPEFDVYYDPLVFKKEELTSGFPMLKNTTPIGTNSVFSEFYSGFLEDSKALRMHTFFLEDVVSSFSNFREYIEGFEINEVVKGIFQEGHFDIKEDIKNPQKLIKQIENNIINLSPNAQGISKKWTLISSPRFFELVVDQNDVIYVYVLGLKEDLWRGSTQRIKIMPEYFGTGKSIQIPKAVKTFEYYKPTGRPAERDLHERESQVLLDYLHLNRGIYVDETTFSKKTERIYSNLIIESESEIFPWTKDDFESGVPKIPIDPIYNMSPWMFPRNFFYDVCLENEYQRVVAVSIKKSDLGDLPIEMLDPETSIEGIIGSIRWTTFGANL